MSDIWLWHAILALTLATAAWFVSHRTERVEIGHALWLLVFVKLLVPPVQEVAVLPAVAADMAPAVRSLDEYPEAVTPTEPGLELLPASLLEGGDALALPSGVRGLESVAVAPAADSADQFDWSAAWLGLWALGTVLVLLRAVRSARAFRRLLREESWPAGPELHRETAELADRLGCRSIPTVRVTSLSLGPALWPVPPTIVLPRALLDSLDASERLAVLTHELVHFKRRDHVTRLLELLVVAVWWWCPLVWWFRRELRLAEEISCDRRVLRALPDLAARGYAETLIKAAAAPSASNSRLPAAATGVAATRTLTRRLITVMDSNRSSTPSRTARFALVAAGGLLLPLMPVRQAVEPTAQVQDPPAAAAVVDTSSFDSAVAPPPIEIQNPSEIDNPAEPQDPGAIEPELSKSERKLLAAVVEKIQTGDLEAALQTLAAGRTEGDSAALDGLRGNLLMQAGGRDAEARDAYRIAVRKFDRYRRAWYGLGLVSVRLEEHAEAQRCLSRAIELGESSASAFGMIGISARATGDLAAAERGLWMAHLRAPEDRQWKIALLSVMLDQDRQAEAVLVAGRILGEHGEDMSLRRLQVRALLESKRYADAAELVEDLLEGSDEPFLPELLKLRAKVAAAAEDHAAERAALQRWVMIDPVDGEALLALAGSHARRGESQAAEQLFRRAMELPKTAADARVRFAQMRLQSGDYAEAAALLRESQRLRPRASVERLLEQLDGLIERRGAKPAAGAVPSPAIARLTLVVTASGEVVHADRVLRVDGVKALIERQRSGDAGLQVVIRPADALASGRLIQLIEAVKSAGVTDISIERVPESPVPSRSGEPAPAPAEAGEEDPLDLDRAPRRVSGNAPRLPDGREDHLPARVVVELEIDVQGRVQDARVVESSDATFDAPTLEAVRTWSYEPALRAGQPVAMRVRTVCTFPKR